jgi:hypothetical protein
MPTVIPGVTGLYQHDRDDRSSGPIESRRFHGYCDERRCGIVSLSHPAGELAWVKRRQ